MKTVLITGCSSGFGYELAAEYFRAGWRVLATMRKAKERESLFKKEMESDPTRFHLRDLDVTSETDRQKIAEWFKEEMGGQLDCLVNNAGFGLFGALEELSEEQIRSEMEVNFFGLTYMTRSFLPFVRAARGKIVNISSLLGYVGLPFASLYCASKFAVEGLSESLYFELKPHGVQVMLVEPGGYQTKFTENVNWGEKTFSENSLYLEQTRKYEKIRKKRAARTHGPTALDLAQQVVRVSGQKTIPLRLQCNNEAKAAHIFRKILPEKAYLSIFSMIAQRNPD